jgi:hypothetical protein
VAVADDLNLMGPGEEVLRSYDNLVDCTGPSGLTIRPEKCALLWPSSALVPEVIVKLAAERKLKVVSGSMEVLGAPVGSDVKFTDSWLDKHVKSHDRFFQLLQRPDLSVQVAYLLLRLSAIPGFGFLTRVIRPRLLAPHAEQFDKMVFGAATTKFGISPPISDSVLQLLSLPIRLGGMGLRAMRTVSPIAYWCAVASAAPAISRVVPLSRCDFLIAGPRQAVFANELFHCHDTLSRWTNGGKVAGLLPPVADFWAKYGDAGAPRGLQKSLCGVYEDKVVTDILRAPHARKVERLRLTSCKSRNAGAWLTCYPTLSELTLSDAEFRYAVRHRLGLPPHSNLPARCICGAVLVEAPWHFHCCAKLRPRAITHRHDQLVQMVASLFRVVGALVHVEAKAPGEERLRPDLEIILPDQRLYVDVVVVHPASEAKKSFTALASARTAELRKADKYKSLAVGDARLLAFAVETYGAFGNEASRPPRSPTSQWSR